MVWQAEQLVVKKSSTACPATVPVDAVTATQRRPIHPTEETIQDHESLCLFPIIDLFLDGICLPVLDIPGLFLSSSMPIRQIDMYGAPDKNRIIFGSNRGASGIDGTIATAIGFSIGLKKRCTLLTGDLAFLYDLNSMAMLHDLERSMVIIVVNNNGGGIFSFLPVSQSHKDFEKYFGTPHHLTFSAAADIFNLDYARPQTAEEFLKAYNAALKSRVTTIIEITTDRAYNLETHYALQRKIMALINRELK